ncbi:MAG: hypothetical protein ACYTJ0_15470 [Planctomycetota bacterium]|jgi:hypothetical protein
MAPNRQAGRARTTTAAALLLAAIVVAACAPAEAERYRRHQSTILEPSRTAAAPVAVRSPRRPVEARMTRD